MNDSCDIQRADVDVDISTIRDRRVAKYDTVSSSVKCFFEPGPVVYNFDNRLGQVPVKTFQVYFSGGVDVREGDRLLKSSLYYLVKSVQDYSSQGFGIICLVDHKIYAMVAP
jgi:hypothetical protein